VRAAAREQLPLIASCSKPRDIVEALWHILPNWRSWVRLGQDDRRALLDIIAIHQVVLALKFRICAATAGPAAVVLSQAGPAGSLDRWLDEIAREAAQPSVRATAYRYLLEGRVVWVVGRRWKWTDLQWCRGRFEAMLEERALVAGHSLTALLHQASLDSAVAVRRVAGDLLIARLASVGADAFDLARRLASDPSPSVAERGRYALEKIETKQDPTRSGMI